MEESKYCTDNMKNKLADNFSRLKKIIKTLKTLLNVRIVIKFMLKVLFM